MSFLGALANLGHDIEHVFAPPQPTRTFNMATKPAINQPAPSRQQIQNINAKIESDGAAMYNAAHPGQMYRVNQNGEFGPHDLPAYMYGSSMPVGYKAAPTLPSFSRRLLNNFTPNYGIQAAPSIDINSPTLQQPYNPGNIPLQQQGNAPRNINNGAYFY